MRKSLIRTAMKTYQVAEPTEEDIRFLAEETKSTEEFVRAQIEANKAEAEK
jgi:hypothetical protein